jgi:hypothetical protein
LERQKTVVARDAIKCKLENDNKIIEQIAEVECLGIKISSDEKVEEEEKRVAGCLTNTIWKNKHLAIDT